MSDSVPNNLTLNDSESLSLVIPAYNESARIWSTLQKAWAHLNCQGYEFELVVVDDGSIDDTAAIAQAFAEHHAGVCVLSIGHAGKATAVREGLLSANSDLVAFSDADLATPLTYLETFRNDIQSGADIVIGSREGVGAQRISEPGYRHMMGRVFNLLVRVLLLPEIQDSQCGFKMFRRQAARNVLERTRLYAATSEPVTGPRVTAFDVELLVVAKRLGYRINVVPVVWTYGTQSKVNPVRDTLNNFKDVLAVKLNDLRGRYDRS